MKSKALMIQCSMILALGSGCGGEEGTPGLGGGTGTPETTWVNKKPTLMVASPGSLSVGDELTILGQDFIEEERGQSLLAFKGTYFDDQGVGHPVDLKQKGKRVNAGKLAWHLWPNILFHPSGDRLGYFLGELTVINAGSDGSQMASDKISLKIQIEPSLIPREVRPVGSGCQAVVESTLEDKAFAFEVEAIGLRPATEDNPIRFTWALMAEHWDVAFNYGVGTFDPSSNLPKQGPFVIEEEVTSGTTSRVEDGASHRFIVKFASDVWGSNGLKVLKTKLLAEIAKQVDTTINVAAVDASGKSVKLAIPLSVTRLAEVMYDGSKKPIESLEPEFASGCWAGGRMGVDLGYNEDKSRSESRDIGFNFNLSAGVNFSPIFSNPFALGFTLNAGFGVDVRGSVSSSESLGKNIHGQILPGEFGAWYRQITKFHRVGKLVGYTECGQTVDLGEAVVTDWEWGAELATGRACIPAPRLKAQKF